MGRFINLEGQQIGDWKVEKLSSVKTTTGHLQYVCVCVCGTKRIIPRANLRTKASTNCGCSSRHGHARRGKMSGTYRSWTKMLDRCYNKKNAGYLNYGGKGIYVTERWHKFENFLADMGERPEGLTLERVVNSDIYEPNNCVWATRKQQANNRGY